MILEFDQWIDSRPRPNLAVHQARPFTPAWRQFSAHWPYSEPANLWEWCQDENIDLSQGSVRFYPVAVSYFDFSIDWPSLLSQDRINELQQGQIRFLLCYSEGDNPGIIQDHVVAQFQPLGIAADQIYLVSANSMADSLPRCAWFADDELLFRKRNRDCAALPFNVHKRTRLYTALVRTHKWWRACTMAELWRNGLDQQAYFSYNPELTVGDTEQDNPIEVDCFGSLRQDTRNFLQQRFVADPWDQSQHNDHHLCYDSHFVDSYLNVVLETHMDVDQSNGVFITEKTFKPIKHAQPFVIFGAAGTLEKLRELGYRTFDHAIDPGYDTIANTTLRWQTLQLMLQDHLRKGNDHMHKLALACQDDCEHNQRHFLSSKKQRLNRLIEKLLCT